jgi:hypothetical protein
MCVQNGCDFIYNPPSKTNMGLFQIIELVIMGVCGILCGMSLYDLLRIDSRVTAYLILCIVADVFIVLGLSLVLWGLFCGTSAQVRSGIICFVVGSILFAVYIVLFAVNHNGSINIYAVIDVVILIFVSYILWIQAGRI